jgi:hypothetical protein
VAGTHTLEATAGDLVAIDLTRGKKGVVMMGWW